MVCVLCGLGGDVCICNVLCGGDVCNVCCSIYVICICIVYVLCVVYMCCVWGGVCMCGVCARMWTCMFVGVMREISLPSLPQSPSQQAVQLVALWLLFSNFHSALTWNVTPD